MPSRIEPYCPATTESTSTVIRLNSSKQPHAPVCARAREELAGNLVVHLVGAIRDNDPDGEPAPEVFRRLSLAGAGGACGAPPIISRSA